MRHIQRHLQRDIRRDFQQLDRTAALRQAHRPRPRGTRSALLVTLALATLAGACGSRESAATVEAAEASPRHIRVIWTERPEQHAIVSWTTMAATSANVVHYDTVSHAEGDRTYAFSVAASRNGAVTMRGDDVEEGVPPGWYHHAELEGLRASTDYYVAVESDGVLTEERWFRSAPDDDRPFTLISGGDSRLGGDKPRYAGRTPHVDRQAMNARVAAILEANPEIIALAHGADWGTSADWRHLYWWLEDNEAIRTEDGRLLPFIVTRGNHDDAVGFNENFWLGDITDQNSYGYYYTTEIGTQFALFTLNTEISVAGDQSDWLEEELETHRPNKRWLMAQYHRPAYPAVKNFNAIEFSRVRQNWSPLFERYRLDLALESDGHALKRTVPIRDGKPAADGVVYVGEGGLGVPQRVPDSTRWFLRAPGMAASAHHVWLVDVRAESVQLKAVGIDGAVLDEYLLSPMSSADRRQLAGSVGSQ